MQRLAVGCTSDAHQLYPTFMARLSSCIFEWDAGYLTLLRRAKREQLIQQGWPAMTEIELDLHISKDELLQTLQEEFSTSGMSSVTCIQDPPNVPLYMEIETINKGGVVLKNISVCQRLHIPGIMSLSPKQIYSRFVMTEYTTSCH